MSTQRIIKRALIRGEGIKRAFQVKECTQMLGLDIIVSKEQTKIPRCAWHLSSGRGSRKRRNLGKLVK